VPQALASFSFVTQGSRAGGQLVVKADAERPLGLFLDIPSTGQFTGYICRLQTEAGAVVFAVDVPVEQTHDTVQLLVPGATLKPGKYVLTVRGQGPSQPPVNAVVAQYSFEFQNLR